MNAINVKPVAAALRRIRFTDPFEDWDPTFFRPRDVRPSIELDGRLVVKSGQGTTRSWGRPYCCPSLSWLRRDVVRIDMDWGYKHRWDAQSYFYLYLPKSQSWLRRTAGAHLIKALLQPVVVHPLPLTIDSEPQELETSLNLI